MAECKEGRNLWRLYNLVWRRTLASQMPDAKTEQVCTSVLPVLPRTYMCAASDENKLGLHVTTVGARAGGVESVGEVHVRQVGWCK